MHPNLALFMRETPLEADTPTPTGRQPSVTAESHQSPVGVHLHLDSSPRRWDHDILSDQHRMLGPQRSWGDDTGSPSAMGVVNPPSSSSPSPPFLADLLPGPMMVDDGHQLPNSIDLWLAPIPDFQPPDDEPPWRSSPSPDPTTDTGMSSPFASAATMTTQTTLTQPSSSAATTIATNEPSSRSCDRRTLELIHFFFNNLTPDLLSPSASPSLLLPPHQQEAIDNPWNRLILPLTYGCEALRAAVCAIASTHLEGIGVLTTRESASYRELAGEALATAEEEVGETEGGVATALAATLLLVHYDSMTGKDITTITAHIKAAHELLSHPRDKDDQVMAFLEKIFHLYDVSAALSQGSEPLASTHSWHSIAGHSSSRPSSASSSKSAPATADPITSTSTPTPIDPAFGLALGLWPTLHRLASLRVLTKELQEAFVASASQPLKVAVLRAEHQSATIAIGTALEKWYPLRRYAEHVSSPLHSASASASASETVSASASASGAASVAASATASASTTSDDSPTSDTFPASTGRALTPQTAIAYHHALCYRESALVYLHRAIRFAPVAHPLVRDSALATLTHCHAALQLGSARLPLWPLLIAACNLMAGEDRMFATQTFQLLGMTAQAADAKRMWSVIAGVWRRMDVAAMAADDDDASGGGGESLDPFILWGDAAQSIGLSVFLG